jgi:hypothetical protein
MVVGVVNANKLQGDDIVTMMKREYGPNSFIIIMLVVAFFDCF